MKVPSKVTRNLSPTGSLSGSQRDRFLSESADGLHADAHKQRAKYARKREHPSMQHIILKPHASLHRQHTRAKKREERCSRAEVHGRREERQRNVLHPRCAYISGTEEHAHRAKEKHPEQHARDDGQAHDGAKVVEDENLGECRGWN